MPQQLTELLKSAASGDSLAPEKILQLVYDELRRIANAKMSNEMPGQTLQATALVHEAWLRLGADAQPPWKNRAHFFSAAAEAMRRILIDAARKRATSKRGSGLEQLDLDQVDIPFGAEAD